MGYDSKVWSAIFYVAGAAFLALSALSPAKLGMSEIAYTWTLIVLGIVAGGAGKLGASPLKKTDDGMNVSAGTMGKLAVFLVVALSLVGCAATLRAKLQQVDVSVYGTLKAIDKYENDLYVDKTMCGDKLCVDKAGHTKFSHDFLIAVQAGKTFHMSLMAWKPGQPVPVDVINVSAGLKAAAETLKTAFADGPGKTTLAALIDAGALAVNKALVLILPRQQANELMPRSLATVAN